MDQSVSRIRDVADVPRRLAARAAVDPDTYTRVLAAKEEALQRYDCHVKASSQGLFKGTYYLTGIDRMERRSYARTLHAWARVMQTVARVVPK